MTFADNIGSDDVIVFDGALGAGSIVGGVLSIDLDSSRLFGDLSGVATGQDRGGALVTQFNGTDVPEPGSLVLLGTSVATLVGRRLRRARRVSAHVTALRVHRMRRRESLLRRPIVDEKRPRRKATYETHSPYRLRYRFFVRL